MLKCRLIALLIVTVAVLPSKSFAVVEWTSGSYEITSSNEWSWISELRTYNDVTVTMYSGGVNQFSMHDNSKFSMYGGSVNYLNLYDNAAVSFFGSTYMNELYIDPANTGWVKLYAYDVRFEPYGSYGKGTIYGNWSANKMPFQFDLTSNGAYSHIQIVPEPATLVMLGLGGIAILKRRKR